MANYKSNNTSQRGFTFLELMIVLSIVMLFSTVTYSSYLNFNEKNKLDSEANALVLTLEKGKKMAQSGFQACDTFAGTYGIVMEEDTYHLSPEGCTTLYDYTFPQAIHVSTATPFTVSFNEVGSPLGDACIILEHTRTNKCRKIVVEGSGTISNVVDTDCACP